MKYNLLLLILLVFGCRSQQIVPRKTPANITSSYLVSEQDDVRVEMEFIHSVPGYLVFNLALFNYSSDTLKYQPEQFGYYTDHNHEIRGALNYLQTRKLLKKRLKAKKLRGGVAGFILSIPAALPTAEPTSLGATMLNNTVGASFSKLEQGREKIHHYQLDVIAEDIDYLPEEYLFFRSLPPETQIKGFLYFPMDRKAKHYFIVGDLSGRNYEFRFEVNRSR